MKGGSGFEIFFHKDDRTELAEHSRILADAGYQGLAELHENCQTPIKKSKCRLPLQTEKRKNRALARKRIAINIFLAN